MSETLRIAQIAPVARPVLGDSGGSIEQVVHLLTEGLVELGHDVTLFAAGNSRTSARLESVYPRGYRDDPTLWDWQFHETMNVASAFERAGEFDVIHSHAYHVALPFSRLTSTPVVHSAHVRLMPDVELAFRGQPQTWVVAVSEFHHRQLQGISAGVVHHGIDVESFPHSSTAGDYLLFLGQMERDKGPVEAIAAARRVGMPLLLAGPESDFYRQCVAPLVDGEQVTYVGSVGVRQRNQLLAGAAALLYPLQEPEPFGLVMIEAMACGTPVAAVAIGAVPELVDAGVTGALAPSAMELPAAVRISLTLDRDRVRDTAAQRFGHRRMVTDYVDLYRRVLLNSTAVVS